MASNALVPFAFLFFRQNTFFSADATQSNLGVQVDNASTGVYTIYNNIDIYICITTLE
jgi:hypothetical protein